MEKVVKILNIKDKQSDFAYWQKKSHKERLEAIEFLRQQYIKTQKDAEPRLQRVCKVIERKRG